MYWMWFEWIHDVGSVLDLLVSLLVGLIAVVVAIRLTKARVGREGAWLIALGWLAACAMDIAWLVADLVLMRFVGWTVMQWVLYGLDLFKLVAVLIVGAGLFMLRPAKGGRS